MSTEVKGFTRRKLFPTHLPCERVVVHPPTSCACCGSAKLSKIGVTETLEVIPHRWKVGARDVHLPGLREDQPAAGAVPCDAAGLGGTEPAGDDPVREVRCPSAAEPPARPLRARAGVD